MVSEYQRLLDGPKLKSSVITRYIATRIPGLIPQKSELIFDQAFWNPFKPLTQVTLHQWNLFFAGFWCWTWDAFDYFSVSMNVSHLAKEFDVEASDITWGITLVLMLRSVGAFVFGALSDRYGRRYPLITVMAILACLQIGLGFVQTYKQFLGVRALFGIFMGGVFGPAYAIALEDAPDVAHGILSGIFQQGYAFGYLLVVVFQRAITDNASKSWRALFWFSAGPCVIWVCWIWSLNESNAFQLHHEHAKATHQGDATRAFVKQAQTALKRYWLAAIYMVLMMAGFNFASHGSQDLYPTLLTKQMDYGRDRSTVTNSVCNLGAIAGGVFIGHLSNYFGRRLMVIVCCIGGGAMVYPWAYVRSSAINAGAFFMQFFVQGAWGIVPIHLAELSPPEFRSFVGGLSYQLGNLASSASSTIEATIGERFPLYDDQGVKRQDVYDYAKVMAIFMGCVFGYLLLIMLIGPENRHADLSYQEQFEEFDRDLDDDEKEKADHIETV
ncbi:unnamed protein product [Ambrosiozyma monospora]|uniref:Unnamed protein product n=1 Tax=Ambrosiozyma monospora TaxID=43982 RepID=A0A9W6YZY5_AMBMO|nr:unnamed protein product [Ambrosiozyma monospora]